MHFGPGIAVEYENILKLYKLFSFKRNMSELKDYLQKGLPQEQWAVNHHICRDGQF